MYQILVKVANLTISDDYCGRFLIKLKGQNPEYFAIIDRSLYLIKYPSAGSYSVIISIEDPANRFPANTQTYTLNVTECETYTTTTTTTTTTEPPPPTTTSEPENNTIFLLLDDTPNCTFIPAGMYLPTSKINNKNAWKHDFQNSYLFYEPLNSSWSIGIPNESYCATQDSNGSNEDMPNTGIDNLFFPELNNESCVFLCETLNILDTIIYLRNIT